MTTHLVTYPGELQGWFALGAALGRFNRFGHPSMARPDRDVDAHLGPAKSAVDRLLKMTNMLELRMLRDLLRARLTTREWGFRQAGGPSHRYLNSTQYAHHLLATLKGEPPPEPLLVLDSDRVVYRGR